MRSLKSITPVLAGVVQGLVIAAVAVWNPLGVSWLSGNDGAGHNEHEDHEMGGSSSEHSRRTLSIIQQNIVVSIAIKVLFVFLTFSGYASLWAAIAADMGVSLLVIFNALRPLRPRGGDGGRSS